MQNTRNSAFTELFSGTNEMFKVQKLSSSTAYKFRLCAINDYGRSPWSEVLSYQTGGVAPTQPLPPKLQTAQPTALLLNWQKRPCDERFMLEMDDRNSGHGFLAKENTQDTSAWVKDLRRNQLYRFRLVAINDDGQSTPSECIECRTSASLPSAPNRPTIKDRRSSQSVRITWSAPRDNGGTEIVGYSCQLADEARAGLPQWRIAYEGAETFCVLHGLEPGASYMTRVAAKNTVGMGEYSDVLRFKQSAEAPGACSSPELVGKARTTSVIVRWRTPSTSGGADVTDYELWLSDADDNNTIPSTSTLPSYKGLTTCEQQLTALVPGAVYRCAVRACNSAGVGTWSPTTHFTTAAARPTQPRNLSIDEGDDAVTSSTVRLCWQAPEREHGAAITEYHIQGAKCLSNDCSIEEYRHMATFRAPLTSGTVEKLCAYCDYKLFMTAVNSQGESEPSESVHVKTAPGVPEPPHHVVVEAVSTSSLRVRWQPASDGGSQLSAFAVHCQAEKNKHDETMMSTDTESDELCLVGLKPETAYRVRVRASNNVGHSSFSSAVVASTLSLPPLAPLLELANAMHNQLKLRWTDAKPPARVDETYSYTLEMQNKIGTFSPVRICRCHLYLHTITGLRG